MARASAVCRWRSDVSELIQDNPEANGLAIIITNSYEGCRRLDTLSGTRADGERMKSAFQVLNFSTYHQHNLSKDATMHLLHGVANYNEFPPSYRRVAFVFSGHGGADHVLYTSEGEMVKISEILSAFFPERAPLNGNLAKLFFIDACRGKQVNGGVIVPRSGREIETLTIPKQGNYLVAYSTIPDHLSYEERAKGGIWITTLAEKLRQRNASVHDILAEVNRELVCKYQRPSYAGYVQQPEFISRLNEPVNLFREAKEATDVLALDIDSDNEDSGFVLIDPKFAVANSLPANFIGTRSRAASLQRAFRDKFKIGGRRSRSFNDESLSPAPQPPVPSAPASNSVYVPPPVSLHCQAPMPKGPKEKLDRYCSDHGKPKPHYEAKREEGKYRATVYVARTCGRVSSELKGSKWEAEINAAQQLLEKLGI